MPAELRRLDDYQLEPVYDEQISPLVRQILAICREHQIPAFMTFQYASWPEGTTARATSLLTWEGRGKQGSLLAAAWLVRHGQADE